MRIPRFVLALLLVGTPITAVTVTATAASANPFTYSQVSMGWGNMCALTTTHQVLCLGDNYDSTLIGTSTERTIRTFTPVPIPAPEQWATIDAGSYSTHCGLAVSGRAFCWGDHSTGSYFHPGSRTPVQVEFPNDIRVKQVQAGYSTSCAIDLNDDLWCWGDAQYIGNGDIEPMRIPVRVPMPDNSKITSLNMRSNVCVTTDTHRAYCWGDNGSGQLGIGYMQQRPYDYSWTPILLPTPTGKYWTSVVPMGERICAIANDGTGYCAGDNYNGSFGNGTYVDSSVFTQMTVPNNEPITSIMGGLYHTCITTTTDNFYCFGEGSGGQLGTGTTLGGKTYRTWYLNQSTTFVSRSASISGTCAIDTTSQIWCTSYITSLLSPNPNNPYSLFPLQLPRYGTPTVSTPSALNIDAESASVTGSINPNGFSSSAILEVATNSSFTNATRIALNITAPDNSYSDASFTAPLNSLAPRTTHYVRVVATNSLGTTTGPTSTFNTLGSEPVVSEITATKITGNEASTSFVVNPSRLRTTISAEFSTDQNFENNLQSFPLAGATGTQDVSRSVNLVGLQPRTTYYMRAIATNRLGTTVGSIRSFLTVGSIPTITNVETSVSNRSISLDVVLTTGDVMGSVQAEVSTSSNFALPIVSNVSAFSSAGPDNHHLVVNGLSPRTDYFVRVVVSNQVGTATSSSRLVHTLGGAPTVSAPIVDPSPRGASLQLRFDANGLNTSVKLLVSADAGADDSFEQFIVQSDAMGTQTIGYTLNGLRPGITYLITLVARNEAGTATSTQVSFTTPGPIGVIINNDDNSTELATVDLTITPPSGAVAMRVSNTSSFRGAKVLPLTSTMAWELLASDEEIAERTVYVQFYFRDGSSTVYTDDIYLMTDITSPDDEAPVVVAMSTSKANISALSNTKISKVPSITISVRDKLSGVVRIETKSQNRISSLRVSAARRGTYVLQFPKGQRTMQIRLIDKAGNKSKWIKATHK